MQPSRSSVSAALFTLLSTIKVGGVIPWATANPRLQLPDDLPANAQPALFLVKSKESINQNNSFAMPSYRLGYFALILLRAAAVPEDSGNTAETQMDNILDAIDAALQAPRQGERQTLGGLVTNCWIDGEVQIDTPVLFEQCAVWIPITVLVGM